MKIINTKSELNKLTNAKDVILLHPSLAQYIVHKKIVPIVPYDIAKNDTMIDDFYNQIYRNYYFHLGFGIKIRVTEDLFTKYTTKKVNKKHCEIKLLLNPNELREVIYDKKHNRYYDLIIKENATHYWLNSVYQLFA